MGEAGKVWTLDLEQPKTKGLHADDVTISLDSNVAPYLAKRGQKGDITDFRA